MSFENVNLINRRESESRSGVCQSQNASRDAKIEPTGVFLVKNKFFFTKKKRNFSTLPLQFFLEKLFPPDK